MLERVIPADRRWYRRGTVVAGVLMLAAGVLAALHPIWYFVAALFASSFVYGLRVLRRDVLYLKLTPTELTLQTPLASRTIAWRDVEIVWCGFVGNQEQAVVRLAPQSAGDVDFRQQLTSRDLVLPSGLQLPPRELAAALESWRNEHRDPRTA